MRGFGVQARAVVVGLITLAWAGSNGFDWLSMAMSAAAITLWLLIRLAAHPCDERPDEGDKK